MTALATALAAPDLDLAGFLDLARAQGCDPSETAEGSGKWSLRCPHPSHVDNTASATASAGTKGAGLLLYCFTCAPSKGQRAAWLAECLHTLREGPPKPPAVPTEGKGRSRSTGGPAGVVVASYEYRNAAGELVAVKDRLEPKSFIWRRPFSADGVMVTGLAGRPLSELPLFGLASLAAPGPVYVVEGEKDALALHALGVAAVSPACGANQNPEACGKQLPNDVGPLAGRDVVVIADRDRPGRALAVAWVERLAGIAASVRVARSATTGAGDDVSDHLAAGHTLDALDYAADPEPEPVTADPVGDSGRGWGLIDWGQFWRRDRACPDFIIPGILPEGAAASLYSGPGLGKSLLTLEYAYCLATGQPIHGEPCRPRHVLVIDHEQDLDLLADRLAALGAQEGDDLHRLHYSLLGDWPPLDSPEGGLQLRAAAEQTGAELVIVDTISRAIAGEENPADTWLRLYRYSVRPLKAAGIAFLRLDHQGKDATKGERGSSAKRGDVDLVYRLDLIAEGRITLRREKNRLHLPGPDLLALRRTVDPLRHIPVRVDLAQETRIGELLREIDNLDLPESAGRTEIAKALRGKGIKSRNADLATAVARRKASPPPVPSLERGAVGTGPRTSTGTARDSVGTTGGQLWTDTGDSFPEGLSPRIGDSLTATEPCLSLTPNGPTCSTCGLPMLDDLLGDGRHPTCDDQQVTS